MLIKSCFLAGAVIFSVCFSFAAPPNDSFGLEVRVGGWELMMRMRRAGICESYYGLSCEVLQPPELAGERLWLRYARPEHPWASLPTGTVVRCRVNNTLVKKSLNTRERIQELERKLETEPEQPIVVHTNDIAGSWSSVWETNPVKQELSFLKWKAGLRLDYDDIHAYEVITNYTTTGSTVP